MSILDRRSSGNNAADNRQRFINRYKKKIKELVDKTGLKRKFKNLKKNHKIRISNQDVLDGSPVYAPESGTTDHVVVGNNKSGDDKFHKGDRIVKGATRTKPGGAGEEPTEGEFDFELTETEFVDIFFSDLELPDYVKQSLKKDANYVYRRSGYVKDGIPARLNLKKTFEQALMRRLACRGTSPNKKIPWLDEVDLRYNHFVKQPQPIKQAVIFLIQDVSGSVDDEMRMLSKKFFYLFYLFLTQTYKSVEVEFIIHTTDAFRVSETEFFTANHIGGTYFSPAYHMMNDIIKEQYPPDKWNIYLAQASDGDNWEMRDTSDAVNLFETELMAKIQYWAYIQLTLASPGWLAVLRSFKEKYKKVGLAVVTEPKDIFRALKDLFRKGKKNEQT